MKKEVIVVAVGFIIMMGLSFYWGFRSANRDQRLKEADHRIQFYQKEAHRWQDSTRKHYNNALRLEKEVEALAKENDSLEKHRTYKATRIANTPIPEFKVEELKKIWLTAYKDEL